MTIENKIVIFKVNFDYFQTGRINGETKRETGLNKNLTNVKL
jgi:hypothetical protein